MTANTIEKARIVSESTDGSAMGRQVFPVTNLDHWSPNKESLRIINCLNSSNPSADESRRRVCLSLNTNTKRGEGKILLNRPVSSFYTYDPFSDAVIVEWGTIDSKSKIAKVHSDLDRIIGYRDREKIGMSISSGHIGMTDTGIYLALFDNILFETEIIKDSPMGKILNTLHISGFLPITADGFVRYPVF